MRKIAAVVISMAGMALMLGLGIASGSTSGVSRYTDKNLGSYEVTIRANASRVLSAELLVTKSHGIQCQGPFGATTGGWAIKNIKISKGRFQAVDVQDGFGRFLPFRVMFRGIVKEGVIRGAASLRYKVVDTRKSPPTWPCWSGHSSSDPLVHFVAKTR